VEELSFLGARRGGEIAGLLTWRAVGWNDTLWLVDVRVREAERRTGVGSALIRALDRIAREERVRGIFVETQIANYPAVRFYQAHGFTISGFNDHLYTNDDLELQDVALFLFLETAS
jgi:ribosomal protein S18 acetylase RimI-like enzyme